MRSGNKCSACGQPLLAKQFYMDWTYHYECRHCGEKLNATFWSRIVVALLIAALLIVNSIIRFMDQIPPLWLIILAFPYLALIYLLLPWVVRVKPKPQAA